MMPTSLDVAELPVKIARLIEECGWNQDEFARQASLNRSTVRQILQPGERPRRLRNATVSACAKALGLSVNELRTQPLDRLLPRMHTRRAAKEGPRDLERLYEEATQPHLLDWLSRYPERARQLAPAEIDELLSLQGTGGPLTASGVEHYVEIIERKRLLVEQVHAVAGTEYLDLLEKFVQLLYDKVRPYGDRT